MDLRYSSNRKRWVINNGCYFLIILVANLLVFNTIASNAQSNKELITLLKEKKSSDTSQALAMAELAYNYWTLKADSTFLLSNQSLEISKRSHFTRGLARAYSVLGIHSFNLGNSSQALAYYDSALISANTVNDQLSLGRIYSGLGLIFANFGDYEKSLSYHFQSLKIREASGDTVKTANSYNNIGNVYYRLGYYEKALAYCLKGLELRRAKNIVRDIASSENNIAQIYDKLGDSTQSLTYYFKALRWFRSDGNQRGITYACHDLADIFIRQKKYDTALAYLKEGMQAAERMKSKERIADFKVSFARYYNAIGNYAAVITNAKESLKLSGESGLLDYARAAYKEMAIASYRTAQYEKAYSYQLEFIFLTDSLQNEKKIEKALQEEFNFKEAKHALELEKKDLIYKNNAVQQRWLLYGVLGALGVITIAFLFYRSARMKKKAGDLLATQKDELAAKNILILEQNKLLQEIRNQLEQKVDERTHDLKISNQKLVSQNVVMEQFSYMTAHNLRGPVARLLGLSSLYNFSNPAEPFNLEIMKRMRQSSADLDEVIHDITAILHVKSGIQDPVVILPLKETVDKVLYQFREIIVEKNIAIQNGLDSQIAIHGIPPYVQSVFYNVISNSIKYANLPHSPKIKISNLKTENQLIVTVDDNGVGFESEQHKEKLFRPFTRFSTMQEGKGLGLYLIKIQMESMGGQVEIKSNLNKGTSVKLTFLL